MFGVSPRSVILPSWYLATDFSMRVLNVVARCGRVVPEGVRFISMCMPAPNRVLASVSNLPIRFSVQHRFRADNDGQIFV